MSLSCVMCHMLCVTGHHYPLQKKSLNLSGQKKIMQPLMTKKSRNLLDKKSHATSRTKKNHATSRDKKFHATSWNKQKNHVTSWDKKKSCKLWGQKNQGTSSEQKIRQPLRTKKKLRNLSGQNQSCKKRVLQVLQNPILFSFSDKFVQFFSKFISLNVQILCNLINTIFTACK